MSALGPGWYLRRLRGMSPSEVVYRALDVARRRSWAGRQVMPGTPLVMPDDTLPARRFASPLPDAVRSQVPADAAAALIAAADQVLAGQWLVLGHRRADSADPDWFADPVTGIRAPQAQLAFKVPHRDESVTGNIKQVWEMSRHHHITVLAAAWWLTEDSRYAEAAAAQLRSWWLANPFLSGVHWTSGIEAGVRLISWVWIRRLLATWPKIGDLFEDNPAAVQQIAWHQEFLAGFVSRGSSANNHVIAEAAGRLSAAAAFPWFARSAGWRAESAELLRRTLESNTFASGVNRELATDYHRFVIELALCAAAEADAAYTPMPNSTWQLLGRALDAGAAMLDVRARPPRQGDGDEGRGLIVDDPERNPWAVALGSGAAVLGAGSWWPPLESSVQAVLLGALAGDHRVRRAARMPREFSDAGMTLLRSRREDGEEIWVRCDGGPHGFLKIAAHAHADALSVEVRHDGVDILADPGTYCYHGEPQWRSYFRSTAAHNTVQLGGLDQSESGGPFLWSSRAQTTVLNRELGSDGEGPGVQVWTAEHDGYLRLTPAAKHRREVTVDSPGRRLTVLDRITTSGQPERPVPVRISWVMGPDVEVELGGNVARLRWPVNGVLRTALMQLPAHLSWSAHRGEQNPPLGWYSPAFGELVPSVILVGTGETIAASYVTSVTWESSGSPAQS